MESQAAYKLLLSLKSLPSTGVPSPSLPDQFEHVSTSIQAGSTSSAFSRSIRSQASSTLQSLHSIPTTSRQTFSTLREDSTVDFTDAGNTSRDSNILASLAEESSSWRDNVSKEMPETTLTIDGNSSSVNSVMKMSNNGGTRKFFLRRSSSSYTSSKGKIFLIQNFSH